MHLATQKARTPGFLLLHWPLQEEMYTEGLALNMEPPQLHWAHSDLGFVLSIPLAACYCTSPAGQSLASEIGGFGDQKWI